MESSQTCFTNGVARRRKVKHFQGVGEKEFCGLILHTWTQKLNWILSMASGLNSTDKQFVVLLKKLLVQVATARIMLI